MLTIVDGADVVFTNGFDGAPGRPGPAGPAAGAETGVGLPVGLEPHGGLRGRGQVVEARSVVLSEETLQPEPPQTPLRHAHGHGGLGVGAAGHGVRHRSVPDAGDDEEHHDDRNQR